MKPDDVPHGQDPSATLIGFVEFFHKASDPTRIFIDKLIMNTHYEGLGFSRRLVRELQALPNLASVEVWSLWKSESFYKALGFVDVISVTSDPAHVAETRRVVRPYGPLLTWYPSG